MVITRFPWWLILKCEVLWQFTIRFWIPSRAGFCFDWHFPCHHMSPRFFKMFSLWMTSAHWLLKCFFPHPKRVASNYDWITLPGLPVKCNPRCQRLLLGGLVQPESFAIAIFIKTTEPRKCLGCWDYLRCPCLSVSIHMVQPWYESIFKPNSTCYEVPVHSSSHNRCTKC